MGFGLGLLAALFFAVTFLLLRVGMRTSPRDDGLFMTVVVNTMLFGVAAFLVPWPAWDTVGVVALAAGGIVGAVIGRYANLRAIRFIGPTRTSIYVAASPVVTAAVGWVLLDETLAPAEMLGATVVVASLMFLMWTRSSAATIPGAENLGEANTARYGYAIAAPVFIGLALVLRKFGLQTYDSAVLGALIGSLAALAALLLADLFRGHIGARMSETFGGINWFFFWAGVAASIAVLSQLLAFSLAPAWLVGVLQGTQVLWVLFLSSWLLGGEERIDARVISTALLVTAGIALIAVGG